jgi:hypothetical protein
MTAFVYGFVALLIACGGAAWTAQWVRARRAGTRGPDQITPVDARTFGFVAAAAVGVLVVAASGHLGVPWDSALFATFLIGLAARCLQFLVRRESGKVTAAISVLALAAGVSISIA